MQITRQADYAIRTILYISRLAPDQRASTRLIAQEQSIPPMFLAKIVSQLSVAGLLQTARGAHGGVMLAKPASHINLLEVVEAIDGPILLNECVVDEHACKLADDCPLQTVWCDAQQELAQRLRGITFDSFVKTDGIREIP
jgi:Rrf2 family protein